MAAESTAVFENGRNAYAGCHDNTIFSELPSNSAGGFDYLFTGVIRTGGFRRTLIKFDISGLPSGALISSASLTMFMDNGRPGAMQATLHRLAGPWGEGNVVANDSGSVGAGVPAEAGDATWTSSFHGTSQWSAAGADFVSMPSSEATVGDSGTTVTFAGDGMVADVETWAANPSLNHGWILRGDETGIWNAKRFLSSEATAGQRPRLTITYEGGTSGVAAWALYP